MSFNINKQFLNVITKYLDLLDDEGLGEFLINVLFDEDTPQYNDDCHFTLCTFISRLMDSPSNNVEEGAKLILDLLYDEDYFRVKGLDRFNKVCASDEGSCGGTIETLFTDPIYQLSGPDKFNTYRNLDSLERHLEFCSGCYIENLPCIDNDEIIDVCEISDWEEDYGNTFYIGVTVGKYSTPELYKYAKVLTEPHNAFSYHYFKEEMVGSTLKLTYSGNVSRSQDEVKGCPIVYVPARIFSNQDSGQEDGKKLFLRTWLSEEIVDAYNLPKLPRNMVSGYYEEEED